LSVSEDITKLLIKDGQQFHASDNISKYLDDDTRQKLQDELTVKFEGVLDTLLIDRANDPNSMDTPRRLAKMYINELMRGRYYPRPAVASFPNVEDNQSEKDKYQGMLVARTEITSMCSHHHQPVTGTCYIGILPSDIVIGLSKYTRIAQWCARRGTLQEELCQTIMKEIQSQTLCRDVGVYIEAEHGCMLHRGVMANSSMTQTTSLSGQFFNDSIKKEFFDNVMLQKMNRK
jgi:GTP cyclohydrolase I